MLFVLQEQYRWLDTLNLTVDNFGNSVKNISLSLDSITLYNTFYQTNNIDMKILNCTLVNNGLKFLGKNHDASGPIKPVKLVKGAATQEWKGNHLEVENSILIGNGSKFIISVEISEGLASFNKIKVSYVNQSGPVISVTKSEILLEQCSFTNNSVMQERATIDIYKSNARIMACNFSDNKGQRGGVVFAVGSNVNITNCIFERNQAFNVGGAIYVEKYVPVQIDSCIFRDNKASKHGGVIFGIYSNSLSIANSYFERNKVTKFNGGVFSVGHNTVLNISGCEFIQNSAAMHGGVFNLDNKNHLYIDNTCFTSNLAYLGSGVLRAQNVADVILQNCIFKSNTANFTFSVLTAYENVIMTIKGCVFDSNPSTVTGVLEAKTVVTIHIIECVFKNNSASVGSMIDIGNETKMTVESSSFFENTGSSLFFGHEQAELKFVNCNFTHHSLPADPLMSISFAKLELLNSTFEYNTQNKEGGIVYAKFESIIHATSCKFVENRASKGGVFYIASDSTLFVHQSSFVRNYAVDASVAYLNNSNATFSKTSVTESVTTGYGGIITGLFSTQITVRDSNFSHSSSIYGGCIYLEFNAGLAAYNSNFEHNHGTFGGALFKYGAGNVSLDNCYFRNNTGIYGGAIDYEHAHYIRLSRGSCSYSAHKNSNCINFYKCAKCKLYTYNYTISNGQETVNSKVDEDFLGNITEDGMGKNISSWLETPYASCKRKIFIDLFGTYHYNLSWPKRLHKFIEKCHAFLTIDKVRMYEEKMTNDDNLESNLLTSSLLKRLVYMLVQVELRILCEAI